MRLIAVAGHGDHGKSTLLQALTGIAPHHEEAGHPGGLAAEPGYAWLTLPSGGRLAFIDVPGHERALPNMIAAIGQVPAVLFVVAADQGWKAQAAEHLAVINALGISHGLLAVTRADLADPGPAMAEAGRLIAGSSLGEVEALAVSAVSGQGIPELTEALGRLAGRLPLPDPGGPVRLWVDQVSCAVGRAGEEGQEALVTGTMSSGTVRVGDELVVTPSMRPVRVQGIEAMGEPVPELTGPARASVVLRGVSHERLGRGMALLQPGRWMLTDAVDVRLAAPARLPRTATVYVGSARTVARVRMLSEKIARVSWRESLPLHVGDRVVLREHGDRAARARPPKPSDLIVSPAGGTQPGGTPAASQATRGLIALDVAPPSLGRRGSGSSAAAELESWPDPPAAAELLRRHGLLRASALLAMGISDQPEPVTGEWLADPGHWSDLAARLGEAVTAQAAREPLTPGLTVEAARAAVGLPDRRLVDALIRPPLRLRDGLVQVTNVGTITDTQLSAAVAAAVKILLADLAAAPFASPDADRLRHLGLDVRAIAAAERAGLLLRVSDQIVLAPGADALAGRVLAGLPQPFTAADARQALQTTRRVAIPLLEFLDRAGVTQRLPDDRRRLIQPPTG
ncbi:MAG TPA: SelB C-terminal domain-containing protein [Streptosporangiaceae bacterium]|nr:SelB C-terminal domain-containing protein [Streptosporangiaceae bacterium]